MRQVWVTLLVGCAVSDSKEMSTLDEEEVEDFCSEIAADAREVTCDFEGGSSTLVVVPDYDDCVSTFDPSFFAGCAVTAGDVRSCYDAYGELSDAAYCDLGSEYPEECGPLFDCILGSTTD